MPFYKGDMRYHERLENAALALATSSPGVASVVSTSCGVAPCDRERFRRLARSIATRFELSVLIEDGDGLLTASFMRTDANEAAL